MHSYILKIEGMMCGMCEAHINQVLRAGLPGAKVSSSHKKGQTTVYFSEPVDPETFQALIEPTGYRLLDVSEQKEKEPSGLRSLFRK